MGARQHAGLDPDRAHFIELAAVEADVVVQDLVVEDLFLQVLRDDLRVGTLGWLIRRVRLDEFGDDLVRRRVVLELVLDAHRRGELAENLVLDRFCERGIDFLRDDGCLLLADFGSHLVDRGDDQLDRGVRGFERLDDLLFRHFLRASLHHHQAFLRASDDDVELARLALFEGRVDQVLAVDETDADAGNRLLERQVGERQRRRGAGDGEHVRVVRAVGRQHERNDLRLVAPAGREERTDRAVDHAAGEDFLLRRLAFTLEEAAGDAPRRVGVFPVVHRQRQEVDVPRAGGSARGDQHHGIARPDDDGPAGLLGQLAGFDTDGTVTD